MDQYDLSDGELVEVEIDIDEHITSQSDESSDDSESNEIDNLLDQVNDLSDAGSESDTNVSQSDTCNTTCDSGGTSDEDNLNIDDDLAVDVDGLHNDPRSSDQMYDLLMKDPQWSQDFKPIHVRQFRGISGPNLPPDFDVSSNPVDYFQLFFTDDIISTICENTNKYKQFRCDQKRVVNPNYSEKHWDDVDVPCMKAYIGLSIMFGVLNQPRYRNYWSSDEYIGNSAVKSVFTLRRYQKISEYLHVSDRSREVPQGHRDYDKLGKIRWLINYLLQKFPQYSNPELQQTVDEGIVKFSGCCKFIQYNVSLVIQQLIKFSHS